jgi:hypothetical protein
MVRIVGGASGTTRSSETRITINFAKVGKKRPEQPDFDAITSDAQADH